MMSDDVHVIAENFGALLHWWIDDVVVGSLELILLMNLGNYFEKVALMWGRGWHFSQFWGNRIMRLEKLNLNILDYWQSYLLFKHIKKF